MRFLSLFVLLAVLAAWPISVRAQDTAPFHTSAKQAILVDYDTGIVLYEKNADEKMPPSSMSKTMTVYLVFEALKDGRLTLDTALPVSEKAWRKGGSKMFVEVGDRVAVEDLLRGVIVQSGNDATIVLAEGLAGTEENFAEALNQKALVLGMENSHFINASGWPDPNHYVTARDLSKLSYHLIHDFPEYYGYFSEKEFTYNNIRQANRNPLIYRDIGADGIKTGHTEAGGYGLIGSGTRDGRRVIMVINGLDSNQARANEGARLLEWGLKGFENITLFSKGETIAQAKVVLGQEKEVPLVVNQPVTITVPRTVKKDLKVEAIYNEPLMAPLKEGTQIGVLQINIPRGKDIQLPLYAGKSIKRPGFFAQTLGKARLLLDSAGEING